MSLKKSIICYKDNNKLLHEEIVKCHDCGHVFANLTLTDMDYKKLYDHSYFHGNEYSYFSL